MNLEEIRERASKKASKLTAGGFRPTGDDKESWLGRVFLYRDDEGIPKDSAGKELFPLAQIHIPSLPWKPKCLEGIELLTAFIGQKFPGEFEPMGETWLIREYKSLEGLKKKELTATESFLKAFPVSAEIFESDWPNWDGGGLDDEASDAILELEDAGEIEDYYDVADHHYGHKVGGYPSFCQSGIDAGKGFEFAFQVSSDAKINLNVVDNGSFQFYRNSSSGEWKIYYDFY